MQMINIAEKSVTEREAVVTAKLYIKPAVIALIRKNKMPKGNVVEAAKIAGILAAKKTPDIIPLCHSIPIEFARIDIRLMKKEVEIIAVIRGRAQTGVEMEAFTAVSIAALTIYDMCKAFDRGIVISDIQLQKKSGGKTGDYIRNDK